MTNDLVPGSCVGSRLLAVFGLQDEKVMSLIFSIRADDIVKVSAEILVTKEQLTEVENILEEYTLVKNGTA